MVSHTYRWAFVRSTQKTTYVTGRIARAVAIEPSASKLSAAKGMRARVTKIPSMPPWAKPAPFTANQPW